MGNLGRHDSESGWRTTAQIFDARHNQRHALCVASGCSWRMLPHDFPPYQSVYYYFRIWREDGSWEKLYQTLHEMLRQQQGKEASPWLAILDSQSVKTTEKEG